MLTYAEKYDIYSIRIKRGIFIGKDIGITNGSAHLSLEQAQKSKEMLVGLSLSACIYDIATGSIPEERVSEIIANTCASNNEELDLVIEDYKRIAWRELPREAEDIIRRMWKKGLIKQPRVKDKNYAHFICCGHWIEQKNIDQIQLDNCV